MKNWKVNFKNGVTIATAFSKCLRNTNQKIPHKILGKVMKFQPLTQNRFVARSVEFLSCTRLKKQFSEEAGLFLTF